MNSIWYAIIIMSFFSVLSGIIFIYAYTFFVKKNKFLIEEIDALLPQYQCQRCTYLNCFSYAEAIVKGEKINLCSPGGEETMIKIAHIIRAEPQSLEEKKTTKAKSKRMSAVINEDNCIGCSKCIFKCPVNAIIGTKKAMHSVMIHFCTGCAICINICPTKCISMYPIPIIINDTQLKFHTIPVSVIPVKNNKQ